ncbi:MAG: hypothetical protein HZB26_02775 [Candidatus Hydrogenedentes bacterium]|nr:hypothetical protein [Candidatus Hydrogenedentota bacterium]
MLSRAWIPALVAAALTLGAALLSTNSAYAADGQSAPVPADMPVNDVPLGAYLPWEFTGDYCKHAGMDQWQYVEKIVRSAKEQNIDTLWLVNIQVPDLQKLLKITIPAGIKVLPCLGEIEPKNHGFKLDEANPSTFDAPFAHYAEEVPEIVKALGEDKKGILAWVLGDEPTGATITLVEHLRKLFREADPERPVLTVNMWPQSAELPGKTRMTTFCVDLYPFFGRNNPNGPFTPDASRNFFTVNAQRLVEAAGRDGRSAWVMGQGFADVGGPSIADNHGSVTVLPGGMLCWRLPTLPEIRWQIWESFRCGAKGFLFFTLFYTNESQPSEPAISAPDLLGAVLKHKTYIGRTTLLDFQAEPTPLSEEASKTFSRIKPFKKLILSLKPTMTEWIQGNQYLKAGNFTSDDPNVNYCIIVNHDLERKQSAKLVVGVTIKSISDVLTGKPLKMTSQGWYGGNNSIEIELPAGDGTILKLER